MKRKYKSWFCRASFYFCVSPLSLEKDLGDGCELFGVSVKWEARGGAIYGEKILSGILCAMFPVDWM